MRERFSREMDQIGREIEALAAFVATQVEAASAALRMGDSDIADDVIQKDKYVNDRDIEISNGCAVLIALDQPVASDLRHLIAFLKAVSDIERIGDYAVHAAKRAKDVASGMKLFAGDHISRMMEIGAAMLQGSVKALIERDEGLARSTAARDSEMDELKKQIYRELLSIMAREPEVVKEATKTLFLSRFLERMGDHAVTICSWAIYSASADYVEL